MVPPTGRFYVSGKLDIPLDRSTDTTAYSYASTLFLSRLREGRMNSHRLRGRASAGRTRSAGSEETASQYNLGGANVAS